MSCESYDGKIMKYFDGDLNDLDTVQLKQHLKVCGDCSEEFEELSRIFSIMETDAFIEPPENFEVQVMDKIRMLEPVAKRRSGILKGLLITLGVAFVFIMTSILTYGILGISIFRLLSQTMGDYPPVADLMALAGNAFNGGLESVLEFVKTALGVGFTLAKVYYYIVVLVLVLLFALQWMLIDIFRHNYKKSPDFAVNVQ